MIIVGGKGHVFLFPPRVLHGFVHPGKIQTFEVDARTDFHCRFIVSETRRHSAAFRGAAGYAEGGGRAAPGSVSRGGMCWQRTGHRATAQRCGLRHAVAVGAQETGIRQTTRQGNAWVSRCARPKRQPPRVASRVMQRESGRPRTRCIDANHKLKRTHTKQPPALAIHCAATNAAPCPRLRGFLAVWDLRQSVHSFATREECTISQPFRAAYRVTDCRNHSGIPSPGCELA